MTVLSLVIIVSALLLPAIMASSDLHPHVRAYVQQRDLVLRDDASPTTTAGIVGTPLALSQSPSPTTEVTGQVGVPLNQPGTTTTSTNGGIVGTPLPRTTTTSSEAPEPNTTSTEIPTLTPIVPVVGTPKATSLSSSTPTETGIKGSPLSSSPQVASSHTPPSYAVAIVVVFSAIVFFSFAGLIFWRLKYRNVNRKQKDLEDEDAMEAYSKYWKGKRNSGGASEKGESTATSSSPVEEKST